MTNILGSSMKKLDERRILLRSIYQAEADLLPDEKNGTLTVKSHHLSNHVSDKVLQDLCEEMNETNTIFPGTGLRLIYKFGAT